VHTCNPLMFDVSGCQSDSTLTFPPLLIKRRGRLDDRGQLTIMILDKTNFQEQFDHVKKALDEVALG
jgi:hypothetical protein